MAFFEPNGYQPEVKLPKCVSAERDPLENYYSNIMNRTFECEELKKENTELREKLKKVRKEKKRWKRKYLGLKAEIEPLDFSAPKKVVGEEEIKITW